MNDFSLRVCDGIFNATHTDQFIGMTYMRIGHGQGGAKYLTINTKQMEVRALSFATTGEVVQNLMAFPFDKANTVTKHHKEE